MLRQACPEHRRRAQPERGVQYNLCILGADCFFPPVGRDTGLHGVVQRLFTPPLLMSYEKLRAPL